MMNEDIAMVAIDAMQSEGADFSDIRIEKTAMNFIEIGTGEVKETKSAIITGAGLRAFKNGSWVFGQTTDLTKEGLVTAAKDVAKIAKRISQKVKSDYELQVTVQKAKAGHDIHIPFIDISIEDKVLFLQDLNHQAVTYSDLVQRVRTSLEEQLIDLQVYNSYGTSVRLTHSLPYLKAFVYTKEGTNLQRGAKLIGGSGGFEIVSGERAYAATEEASELAVKLLSTKQAKGGIQDIITDPDLTGVLVHEAFGHGCEADNWTAQASVFVGKFDEQIGFEGVNIIDDPTKKGLRGSFDYDWEGTKTKRRQLIKNGVMNELLHSIDTASQLNMEANGAARSQSFMYEPIPRMGNTILQPGSNNLEEMISDLKAGLLMCGMGGGYAISDIGQYMFRSTHGYEIENGEIGQMVNGASILGQHLTTLSKIDAIGKEMELFPGTCGKGTQLVPDMSGGPHIRIREMNVGGA
ncbi:MAG: TldD/PmbA family protein [Candidatus Thorarchaeota archaeon]|jgi:TldD protein